MMKICMFTNTYLPHVGGVARSVDFFAEDLRKLDHRVLVVAPTFADETDDSEDKGRVLRVTAVQNFNGSDFSVRIPMPFVIALNASGVREVINDGQNGRLLPADASRRAFAGAIEEFFQNSAMADRWGQQALATARNLSRETCARRLERLYRSLLNERDAATAQKVPDELIPWDSLLESIKVEWDLLFQKTTAAVNAIRSSEFRKTR